MGRLLSFHNLFDLSGLLGCMNVKGESPGPPPRSQSVEFVWVNCANAVRSDSDVDEPVALCVPAERGDIFNRIIQGRVHEAKLAGLRSFSRYPVCW